jgi:hypothetical protein
MAEKNFIDVGRGDASIRESVAGHFHDQRFDSLSVKTSEGCVCPSDDATRHHDLRRTLVAFPRKAVRDAAFAQNMRQTTSTVIETTTNLYQYNMMKGGTILTNQYTGRVYCVGKDASTFALPPALGLHRHFAPRDEHGGPEAR